MRGREPWRWRGLFGRPGSVARWLGSRAPVEDEAWDILPRRRAHWSRPPDPPGPSWSRPSPARQGPARAGSTPRLAEASGSDHGPPASQGELHLTSKSGYVFGQLGTPLSVIYREFVITSETQLLQRSGGPWPTGSPWGFQPTPTSSSRVFRNCRIERLPYNSVTGVERCAARSTTRRERSWVLIDLSDPHHVA